MDKEQIEKELRESGVFELMEEQMKNEGLIVAPETSLPATEQSLEPKAEAIPPAPEQPANETPGNAETPIEIWADIAPKTEQPVDKDWKVEFEKLNNNHSEILTKIEKNKLLKTLFEVADSPEYDLEKFLDVHTPKRKPDYNLVSVENLYKASLADDKIADYTEDEINKEWDIKKAEIEINPTLEKTLKSQLVREFQSKEPQDTQEEPEIIKDWKLSRQTQQEAVEKSRAENAELVKGISDFAKSMVGKKIAGKLEITQEDADNASIRMDANYYRNKDGKLDQARLTIDRIKAIKFDQMVQYYEKANKTEAVIEARKEITRPNANENGGGQMVSVDGKDEATKLIEKGMAEIGLKEFVI